MYYTFANTLAGLCTKEDTGFELEVKKTAGSAANLRLLSSNYIELGIAQADLIDAAYQGTGVFTGKNAGALICRVDQICLCNTKFDVIAG